MRLPNGEHAIVPLEKLEDYCLNPEHPRGRHKARVFASVLGITIDNAELLQAALVSAAATADALAGEIDAYGQRFVIEFDMEGTAGRTLVRSVWIIRHGDDIPRLTSCYVP